MKKRVSSNTLAAPRSFDFVTMGIALVCSIYGLLLVYSATYYKLGDKLMAPDFRSMLVSVGLGILIAIVLSNVDYQIVSKLWPIIAAGCILLMIITMIWGTGPEERPDARSWLNLKIFTFQPSELLKVGFIISFSYHLDMVKDNLNRLKNIVLLVVHGMIPVGLVILTGDAGSALIFLLIFVGMLFFARVNVGYFIAGICLIIIAFPIAWATGLISGLQRERIVALFYPDQYESIMYQQENGKIALGSGGLTGQGFLQGRMTQDPAHPVPANENDMILTVAGEEFGFIGAMLVILLLAALIVKIIFVGLKARDNVGYLMCSGVAVMLLAQLFVNVGMELSILPCIGITLPLFSAGGSSSLCTYLGIGIVLSVYRYSKVPRDALFYADL